MDCLPPEILVNILSFMPQMELINSIRKVCKLWKELATAPSLWLKMNEGTVLSYLRNETRICDNINSLRINDESISQMIKHSPHCYFKNLKHLDISSQYISKQNIKTVAGFLVRCPSLLSISIRFDNRNLFQLLFQLMCKTQIEELQLNYSGSDEGFLNTLQFLLRFTFIKRISVHCDTIQNNTVRFLFENFFNIKTCDITSRFLKNETFLTMRRTTTLMSLNIDYTRVDDEGLNLSQNCPLLQQVSISELHTISGVTLTALANGCPNMRCLSVMACPQIDDVGVASIVNKCLQLRILVLNFCIQLTDDALIAIGANCPLLRKLDIGHNGKFTSTGVSFILLSCRWLEFFGFACCDGVAEFRFSTEIDTVRSNSNEDLQVQELRLSETGVDINNETQTHESEFLTCQHNHVRTITMSHTPVSNSAVLELSFLCPDLRKLYMFGCKNVTPEIIHSLFKNCIFMEKISLQSKSYLRESQSES